MEVKGTEREAFQTTTFVLNKENHMPCIFVKSEIWGVQRLLTWMLICLNQDQDRWQPIYSTFHGNMAISLSLSRL